MFNVNIDTDGVNENEGQEWVNELANVYADMEVEDPKVSGNKISFKTGLSGMDDTNADDIRMKIDEYILMHDLFKVNNISVS